MIKKNSPTFIYYLFVKSDHLHLNNIVSSLIEIKLRNTWCMKKKNVDKGSILVKENDVKLLL